VGGRALNLLCPEGLSTQDQSPFKGNMDVAALNACIGELGAENIPFCMLTITNNTGGGQPVSLKNVREVKAVLQKHGIPLVIDACRFAGNAYFIHKREPGYAEKSLLKIARELFSYADSKRLFENSGSGPVTRQKVSQKRSIYVICEHFETLFNTVNGS
jgi:tyrosine phenol-lyase